jgi:hypothetical protein
MAMATGTINIFESVSCCEPDTLEFHNLPRIPLNLAQQIETSRSPYKINLLQDYARISRHGVFTNRDRFTAEQARSMTEGSLNRILIGAPDLETRDFISKAKLKFISATHGGDSCNIHLTPAVDTDLQIESYGMINLSTFFMNQLRMTIEILKILANPDEFKDAFDDQHVFTYSFAAEYRAGHILQVGSRKLNFFVDSSGMFGEQTDANPVPDVQVEAQAEPEQTAPSAPQVPPVPQAVPVPPVQPIPSPEEATDDATV